MEAIVSPRTVPGMAQRMRRTKGGMLPRDRGRCARARCISPTLRKDAAFREYQQMWLFVSMMGRSISKLGLGHAVHVVARQMVKSKARGGFCCFAVFFMQLLVFVSWANSWGFEGKRVRISSIMRERASWGEREDNQRARGSIRSEDRKRRSEGEEHHVGYA
eukprot:3923296-Rhodomonas_salina.2